MGTHTLYDRRVVVTLLEVSERKEGVVALHLSIGPLKKKKKTALGWSRYRYANPVPTNLFSRRYSHCAIGAGKSQTEKNNS